MVRLTMTEAIVAALRYGSAEKMGMDARDGEPDLDCPDVGKPIAHGQVVELSQQLRKHFSARKRSPSAEEHRTLPAFELADLLRGSQVYIDPPQPKPAQSSEYKALMARLRREEEARAYDRMVNPTAYSALNSNSIGSYEPQEEDEVTYSEINRQVAAIFNVLLSIVACSAAVWMAAKHWTTPWRLALSMGGGGLVGLAEIVIYTGYLRRVSEAKQKEKKVVERKQIVDTWTTAEPAGDGMVALKKPISDPAPLKRRHVTLGR